MCSPESRAASRVLLHCGHRGLKLDTGCSNPAPVVEGRSSQHAVLRSYLTQTQLMTRLPAWTTTTRPSPHTALCCLHMAHVQAMRHPCLRSCCAELANLLCYDFKPTASTSISPVGGNLQDTMARTCNLNPQCSSCSPVFHLAKSINWD